MNIEKFPCRCNGEVAACIYCGGTGEIVRETCWQQERPKGQEDNSPPEPESTTEPVFVPPKPRRVTLRYPWKHGPQPYQMKRGSPEQIERLEYFRCMQEEAWFRAGYSREKIIEMFGAWPTPDFAAYEWTCGYPQDYGLENEDASTSRSG